MKLEYSPTTVTKVENKRRALRARKSQGDEIEVEYEDLGWYVEIEGHSFYVGREKPEVNVGQKAKITLEIIG